MSDTSMVICPACVHEFRAIPEDVQQELVELREDAKRYKADYLSACKTVADMHEAATGRRGEAPWVGVVEDVAAAGRDAERYRKVRRGQHWSVIDGVGETLLGASLDAAVDAVPVVGAA